MTSPTAPRARSRACSASSTNPAARCGLSRAGIPRPNTAVPADRAASTVSRIAGSSIERVPELGAPDDRRRGEAAEGGAGGRGEPLEDLARPGGHRGARRGPVELDDLGRRGPARPGAGGRRRAWCGPTRRRSAPAGRSPARRSTATSATASRARSSAAWPAAAAGTSATTAARRPNRATSASSSSTRRADGWTTSIRTIDSAHGAVQQPPDLEPAEAEPLPDLGLRQVHPVVELGDPHHQADVARSPSPDCEHPYLHFAHVSVNVLRCALGEA